MLQLDPQKAGWEQPIMDSTDRARIDVMNMALTSAGLAVGTGATTSVKVVNTVTYLCAGLFCSKTTAEVAFTVTTHNIPANANSIQEQVYAILVNAAGTLTIVAGGIATGSGQAPLPENPADGLTVLGYVRIAVNAGTPGAGTNFVAATTSLSDARLTVTYTNGRRLSLFAAGSLAGGAQ